MYYDISTAKMPIDKITNVKMTVYENVQTKLL
jgi:hypothetical protein